jgi:DNA repair protein RecO (recombination protein O)
MTRNPRRIQLTPGYILHHGPKAKLASILQPFQMLLLSWTGRGEAAQLTGAESAEASPPLPPACLMAAFYLNELLMKLTTRHDPLPLLFDTYHEALEGLRRGARLEAQLRVFEKRLLETLGYGLDLGAEAHTGKRIEPGEYYHFRPEQGLVATVADAAGALAGSSLIELANERLTGERELEDAKRLLQAALAQCLEGRPLATRTVARAVARREAHTGPQT